MNSATSLNSSTIKEVIKEAKIAIAQTPEIGIYAGLRRIIQKLITVIAHLRQEQKQHFCSFCKEEVDNIHNLEYCEDCGKRFCTECVPQEQQPFVDITLCKNCLMQHYKEQLVYNNQIISNLEKGK